MMNDGPLDIVKKLDDAFNRKDIEDVLKYYEENAIVVVEPGRYAAGKEELKKFFLTVFSFNGTVKQEKMKVIEVDDIALFIAKWVLTTQMADGNFISKTFVATSVFRKKEDNNWRLVIDNAFGPAILES